MKKTSFFVLSIALFVILFVSCSKDLGNHQDVFIKLYSEDNLPSSRYEINTSNDTIIKTEAGIKIFIPKNCFVDSLGNSVEGNVKIEVKEALKASDFILANLTTVSDGKPLQSGGMICILATSNGNNLDLHKDKSLDVAVQTQNKFSDMQIFEGEKDSTGLSWSNPQPLKMKPLKDSIVYDTLKNNVSYRVGGFSGGGDTPAEVDDYVSQIAWSKDGNTVTKDSTFMVGKYKVTFIKQKGYHVDAFVSFYQGPTNTFEEDENASYVFSLKKLGWANIDRFYSDPRTKEVELITNVSNNGEFNLVYVSLICSNQNMYLPGYQRGDKTYSFSHGDYEKMELPIGESVTILATAYKDDKPYFAYKKIVVSEKQSINLEVVETTKEELKKKLEKEI